MWPLAHAAQLAAARLGGVRGQPEQQAAEHQQVSQRKRNLGDACMVIPLVVWQVLRLHCRIRAAAADRVADAA